MKSLFRVTGIVCVCSLLFCVSCKKDDTASVLSAPPLTIAGTWAGVYEDSTAGTYVLTLVQNGNTVTGTYASDGRLGSGPVSGTVSGTQFQVQTTSNTNTCAAVSNVSGSYSGSSMTASYVGSNGCGSTWSNGTMTLTRQ